VLSECSERPYFERKSILSVQLCLSTFFALGLENDEDNVCGEISGINNFGGIMCTLNCKVVGGPCRGGGGGGIL